MESKKEILLSYIKANIAPILVDFMSGKDLPDATILSSNIDVKELNGHYEGENFVPPKWLNEILNSNTSKILVIDKIDTITKEEQTFVFAHEVCHIAFNHILRSEGKDEDIWNIATDAVINQ